MRKKLIRISLSILIGLISSALVIILAKAGDDAWTTNGPFGVSVWDIAIDPHNNEVMYAAADGGFYKSTDAGSTWELYSSDLDPIYHRPRKIAVSQQNSQLLYASSDGGLFISTNGGITWTLSLTESVWGLVVDPNNDQIVYAAGTDIFKSIDGGQSWISPTTAITSTWIRSLMLDPSDNQTIYAADDYYGVLKSEDAGNSWESFTIGPNWSVYSIAVRQDNNNIVFAGSINGLYVSSDAGKTWVPVGNLGDLFVRVVVIDPLNPDIVYVGVSNDNSGVYNSTDGGNTWDFMGSGMGSRDIFSFIANSDPIQSLFAGSDSTGIWKYTITPKYAIYLPSIHK